MCDKHWTDDELISKLFDLVPQDGHLEACPECARRWEAMKQRCENRRMILPEVSDEKLAAQRLAIRAQLDRNARKFRPILIPSLAAVFLAILVSFVLFKHNLPQKPAMDAVSEDKALEDVYQISWSPEPTAIEPVQALFEEQQ